MSVTDPAAHSLRICTSLARYGTDVRLAIEHLQAIAATGSLTNGRPCYRSYSVGLQTAWIIYPILSVCGVIRAIVRLARNRRDDTGAR